MLTFKLNAAAGFHAHGSDAVDIKTDGYTMTVTVAGVTPKTVHRINMHGGTCASQETTPSTLQHLGYATADAKGTFTYTTTRQYPYSIPSTGLILTVHGDYKTDGDLGHIACAEMTR